MIKQRRRPHPRGPRPRGADLAAVSMKEAIVEAASRCIIESGHAALSTRAVAAAAGVNQSLIHYYFGTKEGLMLAVLERMNAAILKRQSSMYEAPSRFAEKWAEACRFYEQDLASGFVRLMAELSGLGISNPTIGAEVRKIEAQWRQLLEHVVREALAHFRIRSLRPEIAAAYLAAFWRGMERHMVLGVPEAETHYWQSLAAVEQFLKWLERSRRAGRRAVIV